ncbi:hypothetical protein STAS_01618 [Striga asiatica]|uniref:Uncharacterized protein n=1 Tax=Striga asiatica TaxID=4170 RepID=A0A5A7NZP0_STRAF|nr:hypothetical protein STAS_01618 [Striga asiatica]
MESARPPPAAPNKSKLSQTLKRAILPKKSTKNPSSPAGFCLPIIADGKKARCFFESHRKHLERESAEEVEESRARAFVARLFAAVSFIKATYAELQTAQLPYDASAVKTADQAVVDELKSLSELKRRFLKDQIGSSPPHVTAMLAEIREQHAQMKIYEITMRKMQGEIERKGQSAAALREELAELARNNRAAEKKIAAAGGSSSVLDNIGFSDFNPTNFVLVLRYALKSVRNFVRVLVREMEAANWDIGAAANAAEPGVAFVKKDHRAFAFESFVCREIFAGFDRPSFSIEGDNRFPAGETRRRRAFFEDFRRLRSVGAAEYLDRNPNSAFGEYLRCKYLKLVHPKMEFSFWGNLSRRKTVGSGGFPAGEFFTAFAEVCRRACLLHLLAFSFEEEVRVFRVGRGSRFSDVYMDGVADGGARVAFTVVPGFEFSRTVVQSQAPRRLRHFLRNFWSCPSNTLRAAAARVVKVKQWSGLKFGGAPHAKSIRDFLIRTGFWIGGPGI